MVRLRIFATRVTQLPVIAKVHLNNIVIYTTSQLYILFGRGRERLFNIYRSRATKKRSPACFVFETI